MFPEFLKDYLPIILFLVIALGLSGAFVVVNIGHDKIDSFMKEQKAANKAIAKELGLIN